ncbi:MAG: hypothetical protein AVDCRST_MAG55-498, partial [uncultured Rubrobacteraceae bacterium]
CRSPCSAGCWSGRPAASPTAYSS